MSREMDVLVNEEELGSKNEGEELVSFEEERVVEVRRRTHTLKGLRFKNASLEGEVSERSSSQIAYPAKVSRERLGGVSSSTIRDLPEHPMASVRARYPRLSGNATEEGQRRGETRETRNTSDLTKMGSFDELLGEGYRWGTTGRRYWRRRR